MTTSGGVDRTTLTLGFEGHQPDIEAMKLLYGNPEDLIEVSDTQESKRKMGDGLKNSPESEGEHDSVHQKSNKGSLEDMLTSLLSSPEFTRVHQKFIRSKGINVAEIRPKINAG